MDNSAEVKMNEKRTNEKKMKEKEDELNGMGGDRKTEPALRCQPTPQIHSNPPQPSPHHQYPSLYHTNNRASQ